MAEIKELKIDEIADAIVNKIAPNMEVIADGTKNLGNNKNTPITSNPATTNTGAKEVSEPRTKMPIEKPKDYTDILEKIRDLLQESLES